MPTKRAKLGSQCAESACQVVEQAAEMDEDCEKEEQKQQEQEGRRHECGCHTPQHSFHMTVVRGTSRVLLRRFSPLVREMIAMHNHPSLYWYLQVSVLGFGNQKGI